MNKISVAHIFKEKRFLLVLLGVFLLLCVTILWLWDKNISNSYKRETITPLERSIPTNNTSETLKNTRPEMTPYRELLLGVYRDKVLSLADTVDNELRTNPSKSDKSREIDFLHTTNKFLDLLARKPPYDQNLIYPENTEKINTIMRDVGDVVTNIKSDNDNLVKYYETGESYYLLDSKKDLAYQRLNVDKIKEETWLEIEDAYKVSMPNSKEEQSNNDAFLEYVKTYEDPYVLALKQNLIKYELAFEGGESIDNKSVVSPYYKRYLNSRFVVLNIENGMGGGKIIEIIFQNKPDKVFTTWVYKLSDGTYELRGFDQNTKYSKNDIDKINVEFADLINDTTLAL